MEMPPDLDSGTSSSADAVGEVNEIRSDASNLGVQERPNLRTVISRRKNKKKMETLMPELVSSASSSCCSQTFTAHKGIKISKDKARVFVGSSVKARTGVGSTDFDALGLPLGMSIAAVISQILEKSSSSGEKLCADYLSEICSMAVRESLTNVFGDRFRSFAMNFEKSFRITLMTLRLICDASQNSGDQLHGVGPGDCSPLPADITFDEAALKSTPFGGAMDAAELLKVRNLLEQLQRTGYWHSSSGPETLPLVSQSHDVQSTLTSADINFLKKSDMNQQLVVHHEDVMQQLVCASGSTSSSSVLTTMARSVFGQARSNDLKAFEISLMMKKLHLQEKKMALKSDSNFLEKLKLSIGFSKASFKAEKIKTQLQEARQVELLKKCLNFLVAGLMIMLLSLAYGTYTYSYRRIIEASESCSPLKESKSRWSSWLPGSTFRSGLQLLRCQIQVFSRILFGALMIFTIAFLLIQRASVSHDAMPITFILLLLGVACGYAGKFCVDTLGGDGYQWVFYWEAFCLIHFFSNVFHSTLFLILHGPIIVAERVEYSPLVPFCIRRLMFFTTLLVLPLLCGFMPFAGAGEWYNHFRSRAVDLLKSGEA